MMVDEGEVKEDFDFDFEVYGEDEVESGEDKDLLKKPKGSYLRSRFSAWQRYLDRIEDLCDEASKYAVEVESGSNDFNDYKKLFGRLNEIWSHIEYMRGEASTDMVEKVKSGCMLLLKRVEGKGVVDDDVRKYLLAYKHLVYNIKWRCNLALDIERIGKGSRARQRIVE